ncbi:restriction endonuclease [Kiritimatiellaeota bacterium B1221]|nr:restriction endonuclease [Kiritimatiellaeota bacterium B1221]
MSVWLTRAGKYGEDEEKALDKGLAIIGWTEVPDLSGVDSYDAMKKLVATHFSDAGEKTVQHMAAQLWAFSNRVKIGDVIVLPSKMRSVIAVGKVTGDYKFKDGRHVRKVDWKRPDVPRTHFGQDLLYSMGAFMTVCRIKRNNAEERIAAVLAGGKDPGLKGMTGVKVEPDDTGEDLDSLVDLEEQAQDQIRMLIESRYKGHDFARLVEAILNAEGYQTYCSPAGPDGGVDILAGSGPMGFESPKICVQVKSGGVQNDNAVRELEGVMSRIGADQGLFVSWDGFNTTAEKSRRDLFFKVRLWDDRQVISRLLANYEKLPDAMQAELPLKRIWAVVAEE